METAIKATALELARGAWAKRMHHHLNIKIASRTKIGIMAVEQQIHKDGMHRTSCHANMAQVNGHPLTTLNRFVHKRPHPASIMESMKSNKRLRKPD